VIKEPRGDIRRGGGLTMSGGGRLTSPPGGLGGSPLTMAPEDAPELLLPPALA